MIKMNGYTFIDFSISGVKLESITQFNYMIIEEKSGFEMPMFEISINDTKADFLSVIKVNKLCNITFGKTPETVQTYQFRVINFNVDTKSEIGGIKINITGIADVIDFFFKTKIQLFKQKATYQALGALSTVTPVVKFTSSDVFDWIRYNITERDFALDLLTHCWISADTFPIFGLNIEKKAIMKDAKKALVENKVTFSPTATTYDDFVFESDNAISSLVLGSGRILPVLRIDKWKREFLSSDTKAMNGKNYIESNSTDTYPTELDNMSNYPYYFSSKIHNYNHWSNMMAQNLNLTLTGKFLTEGECTILDGVKFKTKQLKGMDLSHLDGNYIVTQKVYNFTKDGTNMQITLNRDFIN